MPRSRFSALNAEGDIFPSASGITPAAGLGALRRVFAPAAVRKTRTVGGGAIRKLDYLVAPGAGPSRPVWIVNSTFGGKAGLGNSCANGGALSSIGVSWNILNTLLSENTAVGHGANGGQGGNGGAIYNDGNEIVLNVTSSLIENNKANEGGSAIFFVSNNKTGSITITDSITQQNPRGTFETPDLPGFYVIAKEPAQIVNSQILR